ncbi:MAG: adenylate kinase [Fibrobacterota bacterium]
MTTLKYIVLFGPPGVGKGTQAKRLEAYTGYPHISTGDIFRANIKGKTKLGKKALDYIHAGELVPDELTISIVENRLSQFDARQGFILDGFPRSITQAKALENILQESNRQIDIVIDLFAPEDELIMRLRRRAKYDGRFDDADIDIIKKRLETYENQSKPCLEYFRRHEGLVVDINGVGEKCDIHEKLKQLIM